MPKGRPFQPGVSGNPSGRSKELVEATRLARAYTRKAVETLAEVMQSGDSATARVSAANALLDRGWGKPVQPIDGDGEGGAVSIRFVVQAVIPGGAS